MDLVKLLNWGKEILKMAKNYTDAETKQINIKLLSNYISDNCNDKMI